MFGVERMAANSRPSAVAHAEEIPLLVAERNADGVEVANARLGVVVVQIDPGRFQTSTARRVRLDNRCALLLERIGALKVRDPSFVALRTRQRRLRCAAAPLVVQHHVAMRITPGRSCPMPDPPGPPAKTTSGSGLTSGPVAGTTTTGSEINEPAGSAQFAGTSIR